MVFKTDYRLMRVKSIAECSKESILQYFRPSLSNQLTLRPLFCRFLSGCFTQYLLYIIYLGEVFHNILHAMLISAFAGHAGATLYTLESVSHGVLPVLQLPCFNK